MTRKAVILSRILFALYIIVLAFLCFGNFSSIQQAPKTILGIPSDKVVHFLMFLPFPILSYLSFDCFSRKSSKAIVAIIVTFLVGAIVAASTELGQGLTVYRSADSHDFIADLIGLGLGTLCIIVSKLARKQR